MKRENKVIVIKKFIKKNRYSPDMIYYIDIEDLVGFVIYRYAKAEKKFKSKGKTRSYSNFVQSDLRKSVVRYLERFVVGKKKLNMQSIDDLDGGVDDRRQLGDFTVEAGNLKPKLLHRVRQSLAEGLLLLLSLLRHQPSPALYFLLQCPH